ncbi:hypothetical protein IQ266_23330 [filamentous cyanobacterium LEGE 11480]|uniref:Uncharacterized protein n=1 Tax=Romeriopsis navalis LEGE 11480 TaxID=2777977 RepID=A0A928Z6I6_9CYAN|nr:hypothetical protein [Romeriopsis navalis]MBE9032673.1 hypothetical protein [Romeriopsis navalis LEGE 11480]
MDLPVRYWQMHRLSLSSGVRGYDVRALPIAKEFLQQQATAQLPTQLIDLFQTPDATAVQTQAESGLCLRCYVSQPIVRACQKLANLFGSGHQFSYRDLLPFVLNDDGKQLVVLSEDKTEHLQVDQQNQTQPIAYKAFSIEVLKTYQVDPKKSLSLDNWTYLKTKQHPELKQFLAEFGFQHLSDWAMLNRVRSRQFASLSEPDQNLVTAFHAVYRRDRQQQTVKGPKRCPEPTTAQLTEMRSQLLGDDMSGGLSDTTDRELLTALKQVATQLRQFDVWQSREPLDYFDAASGQYETRSDLPHAAIDVESNEEQAMLEALNAKLAATFPTSLQIAVTARITKLAKSRKYAAFADKFVLGLQHYYRDGLSLKELVPMLGMSSWDQARRILNPGELLNHVRSQTITQLIDHVLELVKANSLAPWPPSPDYLQQLTEQLEGFADAEIFDAAAAEMKSGSHRNFDSHYATQLLQLLDTITPHQPIQD